MPESKTTSSQTSNTPSTKTAQPIVDVSVPGSSLPSDTAKPIMVTNRPMMQDPMVSTDNPAVMPESEMAGPPLLDMAPADHVTKLPPSQKKITIKPITPSATDELPAKTSPPSTDEPKPLAADSIPEVVPTTPPAPKETEPAATPEKAAPTDEPLSESESDDAAPPAVDEKQLAADAAQAAKVADLVKHEVYVLPINAVELRHSKQVTIGGLILIIVLALAWLDLAADAGFIHVSHLPLTHFFRV